MPPSPDVYKSMREWDPSYTLEDAVDEYTNLNIEEAMKLADRICKATNPDRRMFSCDDVFKYVKRLKPEDAFDKGRFSDEIVYWGYYRIDEDGNFEQLGYPRAYVSSIIYDNWKDVAKGKYGITEQIQGVIDAFKGAASSKRTPSKGKSNAKTPASKKKSTAKSGQSSNSKAPARKPAGGKSAKATSGRR